MFSILATAVFQSLFYPAEGGWNLILLPLSVPGFAVNEYGFLTMTHFKMHLGFWETTELVLLKENEHFMEGL